MFTGLTPEGNRMAELHDDEWNRTLGDRLHNAMVHYLETGEMLKPGHGAGGRPVSR